MGPAPPALHLVAGPNGSGKSTLTAALLLPLGIPILDPDAVARGLVEPASDEVSIRAGREVLRLRRSYLARGTRFAIETTLAGYGTMRLMGIARAKGFSVYLIYICVATVDLALDRIAQRVAAGGHGVPAEDVRRRYARSLRNLPAALALADRAIVFDNSSDAGPLQVLTCDRGVATTRTRDVPAWVQSLGL